MTDLSPQNPEQESTYELYTRGVELLESGDFAAAAVPLRKVATREPEKSSVREALGPGAVPLAPVRRGRGRVRGGRRALPDQRFRALLPRPLARPERRARGGPPASRDRGQSAPRPRGLPRLPPAPARLLGAARVRAVVQRVSSASVAVDGETVGSIGPGLLVLLGIAPADGEEEATRMAAKVASLRIFDDPEGRMSEPLGERRILCVSQFTLYGDVRKGTRPSFTGGGGARARGTALRDGLRPARAPSAGASAPGWRSSWSTTAR